MNRAQHAVHNSDINHIHVGTLLAENDTDHKPFRSQEGKQQDYGPWIQMFALYAQW